MRTILMKTDDLRCCICCQLFLSLIYHPSQNGCRYSDQNKDRHKCANNYFLLQTPRITQLFRSHSLMFPRTYIQILICTFLNISFLILSFFSERSFVLIFRFLLKKILFYIFGSDSFRCNLILRFLYDLFNQQINSFFTCLRSRVSSRFFLPANRTATFGFLFYFWLFFF